jgi:polyferredoxin
MEIERPKLIESDIQYSLFHSLKMCHNHRATIYVLVWNIAIFLIFISVFGIALYLCAKNKKDNVENREKMISDQKYVLNKIRELREVDSYRNQMNTLTKLPVHPSGYEY